MLIFKDPSELCLPIYEPFVPTFNADVVYSLPNVISAEADIDVNAPVVAVVAPTVPLIFIDAVPVKFVLKKVGAAPLLIL